MTTELQVLNQLKKVIVEQLKNYYAEDADNKDLLEDITEDNVVIDFPQLDSMKKNTMFFIQPDYEEITDLSVSTDFASLNASVFIMCKGFKNEILVKKVFGFYTALYALLRNNQTLDGYVDFTGITNSDYYPAVTASTTMTAIEASVRIDFAKCF